ncbi:MAG: cyclic nucleotide-binding domain-containing protein [Chloroflexi bacterium]|nr:cyclic nucleotide-binding domain-containing protein [Chloroflexota bacterium]MCI0783765.1 cyclic nucleotide-binding domain-containing protein [Chloroflexota bacterium]MCI0814408.1 cyclic nucleotide-binding domain-containing protein [Chloroflexota bacterium]MCI0820189.1 cyclic nucleotide-binding domain-containing protein [Chloroflexota bacterium]MCI0832546.1 cyclic nucleotide-binding domain-containing protein [Chloroflexota bacterium]
MGREDLLKSVPIFSELGRGDLSRLAKLMVERTIKAGDAVIEENDQAAGFFVVSSGKLEVERQGKTLATYGPGDFFGEMALFEGFPRSATVRAVEDSELLAMTRWDFTAELKNRPQIALSMLPVLVRRLREADQKLAD